MSARNDAIARGDITYITHKPCREGHTGPRYSSTGNCVECIQQKARTLKANRNAKRRAERTENIIAAKIYVPSRHNEIISVFSDLMNSDMADTIAQFLMMIDRSTLTTADLQALLTLDAAGNVVDYGRYSHRHDHAGVLQIQLLGRWYVGGEVMACLRGQRPTVERVSG